MKDNDFGNELYTIGHLVLISGLTDRTIRRHLASGFLEGERINGLWHFTPEQVEAFLRHPAVRPGILAKQNSLVYDFMMDTRKPDAQACIILDLPGEDEKAVAEYFCYTISNGDFSDIRFAFDNVSGTPRVILKGGTTQVLRLVDGWERKKTSNYTDIQ